MKFYSEITKKIYDTEKELHADELAAANKKAKETESIEKDLATLKSLNQKRLDAQKQLVEIDKDFGDFTRYISDKYNLPSYNYIISFAEAEKTLKDFLNSIFEI